MKSNMAVQSSYEVEFNNDNNNNNSLKVDWNQLELNLNYLKTFPASLKIYQIVIIIYLFVFIFFFYSPRHLIANSFIFKINRSYANVTAYISLFFVSCTAIFLFVRMIIWKN